MRPDRSEIINGHEVEEYAWHRDTVVYVDANKWPGTYESAKAWALVNEDEYRYWMHAKAPSSPKPTGETP